MSANAILLRPLDAALRRRVAVVLAAGFWIVLGLARLALPTPPVELPAGSAPARLPALAAAPTRGLAPPAAVLSVRAPAADQAFHADTLLDPPQRATLAEWRGYLREHPASRLVVALSAPSAADPLQTQRIGAALIRALAGEQIDPHRLRLVALPPGAGESNAFAPGEFRASLETVHP